MHNESVRLFIAILLPSKVQQEVARIEQVLQQADFFEGRYVSPDIAHITMKFIGDVDAEQIPAIHTALQSIQVTPCKAQLDKIDLFAKGDILKVVYLNVVSPELQALAEQFDLALHPWLEGRIFVNHITLARIKRVADKHVLREMVQQLEVNPIIFIINSFVLMQSVLTPEGPEYTTLFEYV